MVSITTKKLPTPIIIHNSTASNRGRTPTFLTIESESPAPMKNNVTTNAFLEIYTIMSLTAAGIPQYVLITIANTKRKINQGMAILLPYLSRNTNIVAKARGIIHNALVHLISVAISHASRP